MATVASPDLQWLLIRKTSSYLHRQRGIPKTFSREPMNLKGVNSFHYNGLVRNKCVGLTPAADGKGVELIMKTKKGQQPAASVRKVKLAKSSRRTLKSLNSTLKKGNYRPRLAKLAQRRASQILRSQKPKIVKQAKKAAKPKAD